MRSITRLTLAATVGILATTAACSSSTTAPPGGPPKAGTLAQHFDTLYAQAKALSVSDTNYKFRAEALSNLELGAAFGAAPTAITVTTSSGTEQWKGFVVKEVKNVGGTASDSAILIFAYRDSLVHTMIEGGFLANGTPLTTSLLTNDTLRVHTSSVAGSASSTSVGSTCATPIAGLVNPIIAAAKAATCLSAVFNAAITLNFPATAGVDPALTVVSFPTTSFAGERFFDPPSAGAQVGIASLFR